MPAMIIAQTIATADMPSIVSPRAEPLDDQRAEDRPDRRRRCSTICKRAGSPPAG